MRLKFGNKMLLEKRLVSPLSFAQTTPFTITFRSDPLQHQYYIYIHILLSTLPYQGFSVTGYIRAGTDVKQTEVDCELTNGALSSRY
jgi:hypothetical protein